MFEEPAFEGLAFAVRGVVLDDVKGVGGDGVDGDGAWEGLGVGSIGEWRLDDEGGEGVAAGPGVVDERGCCEGSDDEGGAGALLMEPAFDVACVVVADVPASELGVWLVCEGGEACGEGEAGGGGAPGAADAVVSGGAE